MYNDLAATLSVGLNCFYEKRKGYVCNNSYIHVFSYFLINKKHFSESLCLCTLKSIQHV